MEILNFDIPEEDDYIYGTYRNFVCENDSLDRKPILAGKNILILPGECSRQKNNGKTVLYMDSRYAFGDGRHPTTALCLTLLEEYLDGVTSSEKRNFQCWISEPVQVFCPFRHH